jgi:hypothetical protein
MTRAATQWKSPLLRAQLGGEGWVRGTLSPVRSLKGHPLTPAPSPGNARGEGVSGSPASRQLQFPSSRVPPGQEQLPHTGHLYL